MNDSKIEFSNYGDSRKFKVPPFQSTTLSIFRLFSKIKIEIHVERFSILSQLPWFQRKRHPILWKNSNIEYTILSV